MLACFQFPHSVAKRGILFLKGVEAAQDYVS
jgi:hypothetical protein